MYFNDLEVQKLKNLHAFLLENGLFDSPVDEFFDEIATGSVTIVFGDLEISVKTAEFCDFERSLKAVGFSQMTQNF